MKIKELHLRNIASIEMADIDFEKDLNDAVTGDPSSVFLITGDTGAGKSVILDGISLALYKTTPRIGDTKNKTRNEFTNSEGESIKVKSIEQYTRIGISSNDSCYSEVVFEGNDGVEYRARLSLGITLGTKNKQTGIQPVKHRKAKWEIKIGSADWTVDNVEQTILNAVGLTYAQFSRMAMLAQGQFADFLTGEKDERVKILERLTNTEIFGVYGAAIGRLYSKSKESKSAAESAFNTESAHILDPEKLAELENQQEALKTEKQNLDKCNEENEKRLTLVSNIERSKSDKEKAEQSKQKVLDVKSGSQYKDYKALADDWSATAEARQKLKDLKSGEEDLASKKEEILKKKQEFSDLLADLTFRRNSLKDFGNPQKAVDEKNAEMEKLNQQLGKLNVQAVNTELSDLSQRKTSLEALGVTEHNLSENEKDLKKMQDEISLGDKDLEKKNEQLSEAQSKYDQAKTRSDEADERFSTMKTGVADTMIDIRKRLVEQHAQTCPLCGQHIHEIHLDEEFRTILTPFEKEKQDCNAALKGAENALSAAKLVYSELSGTIRTKKELEKKTREEISSIRSKLTERATALGLDAKKPLAEQITEAKDIVKNREKDLRSIQDQARIIQEKITEAQKEKTTLEAVLQRYNSAVQIINTAEDHRKAIVSAHPSWSDDVAPRDKHSKDILGDWGGLRTWVDQSKGSLEILKERIDTCKVFLDKYYSGSGKDEDYLISIEGRASELKAAQEFVKNVDEDLKSATDAIGKAKQDILDAMQELGVSEEKDIPAKSDLQKIQEDNKQRSEELVSELGAIESQLTQNTENLTLVAAKKKELDEAKATFDKWNKLNFLFGGTRFRTLVQTYILRPLLNNANIYLEKITDRYFLTCSEDNEQLSILVQDRYNKNELRSATVLSGGERFMISLALSLALSSLNRPDLNVNILFIDEGFGTLDEKSLDSVMETLEKLQDIAGQNERRVGIISHREELEDRIPVKICVEKKGSGRSQVRIETS